MPQGADMEIAPLSSTLEHPALCMLPSVSVAFNVLPFITDRLTVGASGSPQGVAALLAALGWPSPARFFPLTVAVYEVPSPVALLSIGNTRELPEVSLVTEPPPEPVSVTV